MPLASVAAVAAPPKALAATTDTVGLVLVCSAPVQVADGCSGQHRPLYLVAMPSWGYGDMPTVRRWNSSLSTPPLLV
uniref:Uncharacterized protein n=1 Tax=Zea mays TaxID=4577 RepID=A0A804P379_MAIZE